MPISYGDISFVIWISSFFLLSLICLALQFLVKGLAKRSIRKASDSFEDFGESVAHIRLSLWVRIFRICVVWGCPIFLFLGLLGVSMYDFLPWYATAILICVSMFGYWAWASSFLVLLWTIARGQSRVAKKDFYESLLDGDELQDDGPIRESRQFNARAKLFSISVRQGTPLLIAFVLIFGICWFFSGACITFEPLSMSFRGMRTLSQDPCLKTGPRLTPCHVYLNVAGNMTNTMFVVFHTTYKMTNPKVKVATTSQPSPGGYNLEYQATGIEIDLEVRRFVYVAYLKQLEPHATHFFVAGDGDIIESYSPEKMFKTADWTLHENSHMKFISGGDLGVTSVTETLLGLAAKQEPLFMLLGGDLAYENGMRTCYRRWDKWFEMYESKAITPQGFTIPLLTAIGNHEAGGFHMSRANAPLYLNYFFHQPFPTASDLQKQQQNIKTEERLETEMDFGNQASHTGRIGDQTHDVEDFDHKNDQFNFYNQRMDQRDRAKIAPPSNVPQLTYHAHSIFGASFLSLDSAVIASPFLDQRDFIERSLNATYHPAQHQSPVRWRFAIYHVPLYPSVRSFNDPLSKALRNSWGPLFAQYHVDVAFENHDHAFKRSLPISNEITVPPGKGTVFLGDGSMGVPPRSPASIHKRDYLIHAESEDFFFAITLTAQNMTIRAINERNIVFDNHVISKP